MAVFLMALFQIREYADVIAVLLELSKPDGTRYHGTAGASNRRVEANSFSYTVLSHRIAKSYSLLSKKYSVVRRDIIES